MEANQLFTFLFAAWKLNGPFSVDDMSKKGDFCARDIIQSSILK